MPGKKAELLYRISVLEGNAEVINNLSKKETKTFITLTEKVQEALKKDLTVKVTAAKLESSEKIKLKTTIHAASYNS